MKSFLSVCALLALCITSNESMARQSCNWPFRTAITISEQSGTTLSDYQVKLEVSSANLNSHYLWTPNGDDFRVFDSDDNTPLEFWVESWNPSNETATVWVRFPSSAPLLANQNRIIYLYYGNEGTPPLANVPFTFIEPGIKFHTKNTNFNPRNKREAFNEFERVTDSTNYGCTFITDFDNVTKTDTFGPGGDFVAYSESYFEVESGEAGVWEFRYGADFGRGGALYINDEPLEEDWRSDLWWSYDWGHPDVLQGSMTLSQGYHKLEVIGYEGCCDGGITVQFKRPGGPWTTFNTDAISIRSRACPVADPVVSFGVHDQCDLVDLSIRNNGLSIPNDWETHSESIVTFSLRNTNSATDATSHPTQTFITLPNNFILNRAVGDQWSCTQSSNIVSCAFNQSLNVGSNSPAVNLYITPNAAATPGNHSLSIEVHPSYYDLDRDNNLVSENLNLVNRNAIAPTSPTCATPQSGIWARFFNIEGYPVSNIQNATDMQNLVNNRANADYVDGQSIATNIDGTNNPFDDRGDEYFLTLLQGYLNIPETGDYTFGVDGDDAIEFRLNNSITSTFYGLHGVNGSPVDNQTVRLAAGFHSVEFRMQEYTGQAAFHLYWNPPFSTRRVVPADYFYHCAGNPNIAMQATIIILNDPINGSTLPKAIPGAVVQQTVQTTNHGNISTDLGSTIITQAVNDNNQLYVGDLSGNGPIQFINNPSPHESGVDYTYQSLNNTSDSLSFSNNNGSSFDYTPTPDAQGYDKDVTHFRLNLDGTLKPKLDASEPGFKFTYQLLLE